MNIAKQKEIVALENEQKELMNKYSQQKGQLIQARREAMINTGMNELRTYLEQIGFVFTKETIDYKAESDGVIIKIRKINDSIDVWMPNNEHYYIKIDVNSPQESFTKQSGLSQSQEIEAIKEIIDNIKSAFSRIDQVTFEYKVKKGRTDSSWNPSDHVTTNHPEFHTVLAEMFS
ncbi:hypothetical protein [Niallia taxi]|uniref:Uncharacterized protein n=1 Tax=Niallia taxi TaxID=2499688 RepID=A0A3S2U6A5_9BACI|nr:hypothetical protein [Niallia taxi]RVT56438.1 hypothetical protein EM808_27505 [Niallia taxi]